MLFHLALTTVCACLCITARAQEPVGSAYTYNFIGVYGQDWAAGYDKLGVYQTLKSVGNLTYVGFKTDQAGAAGNPSIQPVSPAHFITADGTLAAKTTPNITATYPDAVNGKVPTDPSRLFLLINSFDFGCAAPGTQRGVNCTLTLDTQDAYGRPYSLPINYTTTARADKKTYLQHYVYPSDQPIGFAEIYYKFSARNASGAFVTLFIDNLDYTIIENTRP